jgi:2,3-bisphosphoglycerate-independent phosphoglycerate mutase
MKYILLVPDGAADEPLPELDGKTPLEAARTPYLDDLAKNGTVGVVNVTPPGMYPGSDAANMALLGYDPREHYTGRGPVEAAAMEIPMDARDVAFRCSLVTTDGEKMLDYSAGHVATEEARPLIELAAQKLGTRQMHLFPGVSYRHILLWNDGPMEVQTFPPHEHMGEPLAEILPVGEREERLRQFIWDSLELLDDHPYNRRRREEGRPPANTLWPWGQGRAPQLPSFFRKRGMTGAVIAAVDVVKGLGRLTGLEVVRVPGATGYFDTDYFAKARCALDALNRHPFVWIHVEAPDEAGHAGSIDEKIKAIENIDRLVVGPLLDGLKKLDDFRLLVAPDHATPIATRGHRANPIPYLLFDSRRSRTNRIPYDERAVHENVPHVEEGWRLIEELLKV